MTTDHHQKFKIVICMNTNIYFFYVQFLLLKDGF